MSSPTSSITVIFIVLSVAAAENRCIVTMEVAGAYHNASVSSIETYMYFNQPRTTMLCELALEYKKSYANDDEIVMKYIESVWIWY